MRNRRDTCTKVEDIRIVLETVDCFPRIKVTENRRNASTKVEDIRIISETACYSLRFEGVRYVQSNYKSRSINTVYCIQKISFL